MRRSYLALSFILIFALLLSAVIWADWPWDFDATEGGPSGFWESLSLGQYEQSLREAEKAVRQQPGDTEAHLALALLLQERGDGNRAEIEYRQAFPAAEDRPYLQTVLGQLCLARDEWANARRYFENALARLPGLAEAGMGLAQALTGAGDRVAAVGVLRRQVKENPACPEAFLLLGDLLVAAKADPNELVAIYEKAVAGNPAEAELHLRLARALAQSGQTVKARAEYARVLALEPENAEARKALGL